MKKLMLTLALAVAAAATCAAQSPIYNPSTKTLSLTISVDTSQVMYGCPTNTYNAEGQCMGGMHPYVHTGYVSLSMKNTRTGVTVGNSQTVVGGIATASAVLTNVQPGDVVSYSETNQVYCPMAGVWYGITGLTGWWEIAYTRFYALGGPIAHPTLSTYTWNVAYSCTDGTPLAPVDYVTSTITDTKVPEEPFGWEALAFCVSLTGRQPWACHQTSITKIYSDLGPGSCTQNQ